MRIFGGILIVLGFLSCLSIVGMIWGIPMILIGIVCMLVGRRKVVVSNVITVNAAGSVTHPPNHDDFRQASPFTNGQMRQAEPRLIDVTPTKTTELPQRSASAQTTKQYDEAKWNALVRYDEEIARVVAVLQPHGQKYVDELAVAYLALNDKQYLPMIIKKILETAKKDFGGGNDPTIRPAQRQAY